MLLCFIFINSRRILIFICIFGYFFQKGHFKGSSKKKHTDKKTLGGITTQLPPFSGGPDVTDESDFSENEIPDLNPLRPFQFEPKTNIGD